MSNLSTPRVRDVVFRSMKEHAAEVVRTLEKAGHVAYFAGGCVRDQLLGIEPKDYDIATDAHPEQVQKLFRRVTDLQGKSFGVLRVMTDGFTFEVATFRREGKYTDGRRPDLADVEFSNAEQDAQRRDFTINGLFFHPGRNEVIDYVGGQDDLKAKVLRAIGQPEERFAEDKLRLLRAIRFATNLRFKIEEKTWQAIQDMAPQISAFGPDGKKPIVSPERRRDELDKIWAGPRPDQGLELLDQSGLLREVLPDIAALHGVEQPPQFHPEGDVYTHTRLMLGMLHNAPLELALSVLFHDVGKKATYTVDPNGRIRFNEHESVGARMTEQIMTDLRYSNDMIEKVVACVQNHMTFKDVPKMKVSTIKRLMSRSTFPTELELHRIDCTNSHGDLRYYDYLKEQQDTLKPDDIRPPRLITGHDVLAMGVPPGVKVRMILEAIETAQLEGKIETREQALEMARKLAAE